MNDKSGKSVTTHLREALISMIALSFIEEYKLLTADQLDDAQRSLQALFLRTSGEETMLRKLIDTLKATKALNEAFSDISKILAGISRSVDTVETKLRALRTYLGQLDITAEENEAFVGPFLVFSQDVLRLIESFQRNMQKYLEVKENEARCANIFRIAQDARARLRARLSGNLGAETQSEVEDRIRREVMQTFDYGETEANLKYAKRESRMMEEEITGVLAQLQDMCQMAMNPQMREKPGRPEGAREPRYTDVFSLYVAAHRKYPRLADLKNEVLDLFKLYQHSYGLFSLDFRNLSKAVEPMIPNAEQYFEAKEEDADIRVKRDKLRRIEGLIPFLEQSAQSLADKENANYTRFSRKLSEIISEKRTPWEHVSEDLLRIKVVAEADLSTRL